MPVRPAGTAGSRPSTRTCPWVGGSAVASSRSSVVLPAPLGPSSPVTPGPRSRSTPASARVAPNVRPTPRRLIEAVTITTSTAAAGAAGPGAPGKPRTKPPPAPGTPPAPGPGAPRPANRTAPPAARPPRARHELTAIGRAQRADPGRRGQHHRDEPDRRQQPRERCLPGYDQPGQQHRRQREREHRDRAQQDQPEHRIRRDEFRFQRRVQPRVVASRDHQARHDRRHRQEQPHPAGVPDRRRERGEHQDRGHPGQPHPAERAGHRDQPRLGGGQARAAQQPLEHRRPRHLDGVPGAVPHRGEVDHAASGHAGRGAHPRPARPAGQQVLLGRGPFGQRIGPPDVAPQHVVVEVPAGHDGPSARAARRCALAR